jgi:hypothetical protein
MFGVLGFDSRRGLGIFLFTTASRTALWPTQPPIQWVPGALSLGEKRPAREADHSPPSSVEIIRHLDTISAMDLPIYFTLELNFYTFYKKTYWECSIYFHNKYVSTRAFEKFVDSPYYSESELCGSAVTVSFSKYLPWQAMHFLQRSTHFSKTCCRPFAASFRRIVEQAVLTSELPFHGWKSPEIA